MDNEQDPLLESLDDEAETEKFKITFSSLQADCDQMIGDIQEEWISKCFDLFSLQQKLGIILVTIPRSRIILESIEVRPGPKMRKKKS